MRRFLRRCRLPPLVLLAGLLAAPVPGAAQQPAAEPTPEQVKSLLQLLADPVVKGWIERGTRPAPAPEAAPPAPELAAVAEARADAAGFLESRVAAWKARLAELAAAVPGLPRELGGVAERVSADLSSAGPLHVALLLAVFVGLGYGCELLFWRASARLRRRIVASALDTPADRAKAASARFLFGLAWVLSFAVGSIGAFLLFPWPPGLRALVLGYLLAVLALRVTLVLGRFLFAPGAPRFRVVPMGDAAARLWHRALAAFVGWYAFGYVTIQLLGRFGMGIPALRLLAYLLGLGLLAIALRLIWRCGLGPAGRAGAAALAALIYVAWVVGARPAMWTLLVAALLPLAIRAGHRAVEHLFRRDAAAEGAPPPLPASAVLVDRTLRFLLIAAGAWVLVWGWGVDYGALTNQDDPMARLARGALHALLVLLVADLLWKLASTAIDRQIALTGPADGAHDGEHVADLPPEEERRRARVRTLLPILRIMLLAVLAVMAVLMALSALGVQIAPLIAGAGVVGVAIGFGSQTLVRDIISGMFYLLDDAFRVGEYIVSGNFRGTVEGFSLRSVKLRHHRGPLFTVPFGNLGAVQNMSRDWVIEKLTFNVPFDTDVAKVKKIVKRVSQEIMDDPALAKGILEPLKSQGVNTMNDFAMQIRVKFKARPFGQFAVRRAAYDKIRRALAENGIRIAVPTVSVAGGEDSPAVAPAAAQQAMEMTQKPAAAAAE